MLDERVFDLGIAVYTVFSSIVLGTTCIKRKFLSIWFYGSVIMSVGAIFYYIRAFEETFRVYGDLLYMFAVIIFIYAIYYEYSYNFSKRLKRKRDALMGLFMFSISFSIGMVQAVMIILLIIILYLLIKIYLKQRTIIHISMFLTVSVGLFTLIMTFLSNFGVNIVWELSYMANIAFITFILITALAAPIEDRIRISEEKVRKNEAFLTSIFNSIQDGISILDENLTIIQVNPTMEKRHSHAMPLIGKKCYEAYHFSDIPCEKCPSINTLTTNESGYEIVPLRGPEGEIIGQNELFSFPLVDAFTGQTKGIIEYVRDITERVETEQRLSESEYKFRNLFDKSPLMIGLVDKEGKLVDCNEQFINQTQYERNEILSSKLIDLDDIIPATQLSDINVKFQEALENKFSEPVEFQLIRKDGEMLWLRAHNSVFQLDGEPFVQIIMEDIEKEKQAEEITKKTIKELKELDETRKNLITRVSHELRTPLTSIYGVSQIFMDRKNELDFLGDTDFVGILYRGSIRLRELVNNLLDASKLDASKIALIKSEENIIILIENCINDMIYLAENRGLKISKHLPEELYFNIDRFRFQQIFINMLSNAIKNTPHGGQIFINLLDKEKFIDIIVKDTGVGLTPDEKKLIFKKFGKIERYGMDLDVDIEGAGLGLYISKELVERHGGTILIESEGRNQGTKVTIRLFKKQV